MAEALEIAEEAARRADAVRISSIRMRIGGLAGVVPDALQFAFEAITPGTLAEGATLEVEAVAVRAHCGPCDADFEPLAVFYECPRCGVPSGDIRAGSEIEVVAVEVETATDLISVENSGLARSDDRGAAMEVKNA